MRKVASHDVHTQYQQLGPEDLIVGRIRMQPGEEHLLLDLVSRGITLIPSAIAQLCSRSKVFQTRILGGFMIPGTSPVYSAHDMTALVSTFCRRQVREVVVKLDRANGGQGVMKFNSIEDVNTHQRLGTLATPFVVQPFVAGCKDVRVVALGDRIEAYRRCNPYNFRQNLACGGKRLAYTLNEEQHTVCRAVMDRAEFPYACLDLMVSPQGTTWLSEINLRGGLQGAQLSQKQYLEQVEKIHVQLADDCCCLPQS